MGRIPKLPLIKIGVGITGEEDDWQDGPFRRIRAVLVPVLIMLYFLASKVEAKCNQDCQGIRLV